jgi:hypothetical protein
MAVLQPITDPTDIATPPKAHRELSLADTLADQMGFSPMTPAQQWLYDHRRGPLAPQPYVDLDEKNQLVLREGMEAVYPGLASVIHENKLNGMSDERIDRAIQVNIAKALEEGRPDQWIEQRLYGGAAGLPSLRGKKEYLARVLLPQKVMDYLSWGVQESDRRSTTEKLKDEIDRAKVDAFYADKKYRLLNDVTATVGRFFGATTFGLGPLAMRKLHGEGVPAPETTAGVIASEVAGLGGFLMGPYKAASWIWGSAAAPTATGLRGVAEILTRGGANLGTATLLSSAVPAFESNPTATDATVEILNSTSAGTVAGVLFPVAGAVESKALRLALGMAIADKLRAGTNQWFTIDDVVKGIHDGSIDKDELAKRTYGYLLDLYFMSRVPSMKQELQMRGRNAMIEQIMQTNPQEAEKFIVALGKAGLVPGTKPEDLEGATLEDIRRQFGGVEGYKDAFRTLPPEIAETAKGAIREETAAREAAERRSMALALSPRPPAAGGPSVERPVPRTAAWEPLVDSMVLAKDFMASNSLIAALHRGDLKAARRELARLGWDASANVKKALLEKGGDEGKEVVIRKDLVRGAPRRAWMIYDDAAREIYGDLTKADHIALDELIQARRNIAISKYKPDFAFQNGRTADQFQHRLDTKLGMTEERFAKLNTKADRYFEVMRESLDRLKSEGLLTQESYDGLVSKGDYERRNIIDWLDPETTYMIGGRKITVPDSGIQKLSDEGSVRVAETNSMLLMQEVIARSEARIMKNRANKALYDLAKNQPENGIVRENEITGATEDGKPIYAKAPAGFQKITAMIDGKPKEMLMPNELAHEWVTNDPMVTQQWARWMGWLSGGNILRPMATGYNPCFAATNMIRDIIHAWTTTTEGGWSSFLPLAAAQMGRDYATVAHDAFFRVGRYSDYIMEGGGMSFLAYQGRIGEGLPPTDILTALPNLFAYAGETSEIWTRLALRERALRNGYKPYEATWMARNYLDFDQGGSAIKAADVLLPYLNAPVQATRGTFRAFRDAPMETLWKVSQLGLIAAGLYLRNREDKEFWNSVSPQDKVTGLNWRVGKSFVDTDGTARCYYVHIPLDQTQQVFSRIFEGITAKTMGDPVDVDSIVGSVQSALNLEESQYIPPNVSAALVLFGNYDTWTNDQVWTGPNVQAWREFGPQTSPAAVGVGGALNVSPTRLERATQKLVTQDNPLAWLAGEGLDQIFEKLPEQQREETSRTWLSRIPLVKRFLRVTEPYRAFEKTNEQIAQETATERLTRSMELDAIADKIANGKATRAEAMGYIRQQPMEEIQRLNTRLQRDLAWAKVPDRRWWVDLSESPPESAAAKYWFRYEQSNAEERKALEATLHQLHNPRIATDKFMHKLTQLRKSQE